MHVCKFSSIKPVFKKIFLRYENILLIMRKDFVALRLGAQQRSVGVLGGRKPDDALPFRSGAQPLDSPSSFTSMTEQGASMATRTATELTQRWTWLPGLPMPSTMVFT